MLNENLDFQSAPPHVKRAFLGVPEKTLISARTRVFKWTDYPLVGPQGITPWWSFAEQTRLPSGLLADGLRRTEELANRLGASAPDYQRVRSAVSDKFNNSMRHLLMAELMSSVWAFAGKSMGQPEFADPTLSHIFLIGGSCQLWIPNLTASDILQVSAGPR